jgi:hypothetical protein
MKRLRRCLGTAQAKKALVVAELDILDVQRDDFAVTGRYLGASAPSGAPATFLGGLGRLIRQAASHGVELGHKPTRQRTGQSDARIGLGRPRETVQRFLAWQVSTRSQVIEAGGKTIEVARIRIRSANDNHASAAGADGHLTDVRGLWLALRRTSIWCPHDQALSRSKTAMLRRGSPGRPKRRESRYKHPDLPQMTPFLPTSVTVSP